MNKPSPEILNKQIYYRLIALWVICEALLGGIIHGFKLPVSGMVVGSCAVVCISLIARFAPQKGSILKATIIVCVFKMMLSPQTPGMAYIAVLFQGLMGELFFINRRFYKIPCLALGIVALAESAVQRIFIFYVLMGKDFWTIVNETIAKFFPAGMHTNYSWWAAGLYLVLHCSIGLLAGLVAIRIINRSAGWEQQHQGFLINTDAIKNEPFQLMGLSAKKKTNYVLVFIFFVAIAFLIQAAFKPGREGMLISFLVRPIAIITGWLLILNPLIARLLKKWLTSEQAKSSTAIAAIVSLLPSTQYIFQQSWQLSKASKGWRRIAQSAKIIIINTLHRNEPA
jgi:hypothetical protein